MCSTDCSLNFKNALKKGLTLKMHVLYCHSKLKFFLTFMCLDHWIILNLFPLMCLNAQLILFWETSQEISVYAYLCAYILHKVMFERMLTCTLRVSYFMCIMCAHLLSALCYRVCILEISIIIITLIVHRYPTNKCVIVHR